MSETKPLLGYAQNPFGEFLSKFWEMYYSFNSWIHGNNSYTETVKHLKVNFAQENP